MHSFQAQEFSYVEYHMPTELLILSAKKGAWRKPEIPTLIKNFYQKTPA